VRRELGSCSADARPDRERCAAASDVHARSDSGSGRPDFNNRRNAVRGADVHLLRRRRRRRAHRDRPTGGCAGGWRRRRWAPGRPRARCGRVFTSRRWTDLPVDLGASWIHGAARNPIADLVKSAGIQTVATDYTSTMVFAAGSPMGEDWQRANDRRGDAVLKAAAA
jgi:hypothetical protein